MIYIPLNYTMKLMLRYKKNDVSIDQSLIASHGHGDVYQLANKKKGGKVTTNPPIHVQESSWKPRMLFGE
jgi:hypothetical protein